MKSTARRTDVVQRARRAASAARRRAQSYEARHCRRLGVFCYHQVGPTHADPWDLAVSPEHFEEQLGVMAESGEIVGLNDIIGARRGQRIGTSQPLHAITFDDGYVDNLTTALPALERHEAPVTVFIPTGFLDAASFWWDRVAALTLTDGQSVRGVATAALSVGLFNEQLLVDVDTWMPRRLHDELYESVCRHQDIDGVLDALDAELPGAPRPHQRPMTTDELVRFAGHPLVCIGGHTVSHPTLPDLDLESATTEIRTGLERLHEILGHRPRVFAYPHGVGARREGRVAESLGVDHAFTTADRWVSPLDGAHHLPRLHPKDLGGEAFGQWLMG